MAQRTAGAGRSRSSGAKSRSTTVTAAASTKKRTTKPTSKKAPAKKAPAKAAVAKAAVKKPVAKRAPAKKAPTKRAPAKKAPAKKPVAKKAPVKKAPVKKASTKKAPAKKTSATKASAKKMPAPKAPATKAPATRPLKQAASASSARPSARGRKPLTPADRAEMKGVLLAERKRLEAEIATAVEDLNELLRDSGEGSGDDQADAGSKTFEREHEMSVANNSRDLLIQVEHALQRIADGTYGTCESCGLPIGKMRLEAFPRATLCVDCKQREERR